MTTEGTTVQPPVEGCLKERKWWCFLLSSIFTFLAGLLIVLLWRAFAFLCCRKEPELAPNDPKRREPKAGRQGKEFEGTFMTEAKDWAGELISGQTTTGRILVRLYFLFYDYCVSARQDCLIVTLIIEKYNCNVGNIGGTYNTSSIMFIE